MWSILQKIAKILKNPYLHYLIFSSFSESRDITYFVIFQTIKALKNIWDACCILVAETGSSLTSQSAWTRSSITIIKLDIQYWWRAIDQHLRCCNYGSVGFLLLCWVWFFIVMLSVFLLLCWGWCFYCYTEGGIFIVVLRVVFFIVMVSVVLYCYAECFYCYAECSVFIVMLSVVFLLLCWVWYFYCYAECGIFIVMVSVVFLLLC